MESRVDFELESIKSVQDDDEEINPKAQDTRFHKIDSHNISNGHNNN